MLMKYMWQTWQKTVIQMIFCSSVTGRPPFFLMEKRNSKSRVVGGGRLK